MANIQPSHTLHASSVREPSNALVLLLASGAGFSVAALYYAQPLLGVLGTEMSGGAGLVGLAPMLAQTGYALGILLLAPLGDRYDRRRIILTKASLLVLALLLCGLAPTVPWLLAGSLLAGLTATAAQDIVPAVAVLAPPHRRGRLVGMVMTGLLLGILLSRVASGLIAEQYGWRAVFFLAAAAEAGIVLASWIWLPRFKATTSLPYGNLLRSMLHLWRAQAPLRRATFAQATLSIGFSAFWSTLAIMLHQQHHAGSALAGAFGLAGAAGTLAAPLAGRLADRHGAEIVTRLGAALCALSFAVLLGAQFIPLSLGAQLALLAVGAVGFDFGIQATLVAHQTIVYGLQPEARSRLNALMFTGIFIGMALGTGLGSLAQSFAGWGGVMALASLASLVALAIRMARGHGRPVAV
ncbi:MFS transporter [Rhodovastum atsumiense]|uniref:MFS transporter n=1 Tax=Rhodovastum atsumiense TaxID=504468 RepID=A0A5M6IIZ7_9PROT|nr:MFS transporter [Rhodovastum atsumiense]KAA5608210.1 MFS transporter [Rhodovastum atsumiense]CAH2602277.1 MFS transporter [Rhodovastum atsumiense]